MEKKKIVLTRDSVGRCRPRCLQMFAFIGRRGGEAEMRIRTASGFCLQVIYVFGSMRFIALKLHIDVCYHPARKRLHAARTNEMVSSAETMKK